MLYLQEIATEHTQYKVPTVIYIINEENECVGYSQDGQLTPLSPTPFKIGDRTFAELNDDTVRRLVYAL